MTPEALSPAARQRLLDVARQAIHARLDGREFSPKDDDPALQRPCGAFVTLKHRADGELRGCVGYVEPRFPLVEAVALAAVAAATADGRFAPVTRGEMPSLSLDISALGPVEPIDPERVEVGTHGLIVRYAGRSGLLLPQVATEHGWDRVTLLEQTCRKAGLPQGTWRKPGVQVLAFTATVFGEQ